MDAVRCAGCGGTVVAAPGARLPACLFCGETALAPVDALAGIEPPEGALPFAVSDADVAASFARFAKSSIWYPSDLRSASLTLRRLLLPAWAWSGRCESHWTGLVSASTASGKRPVAGRDTLAFAQILVPASSAVRLAELGRLGSFDESSLAPFDPSASADPFEVGQLTRSAARAAAEAEMGRRHGEVIRRDHGLLALRQSALVEGLSGRPVLVPIYIGAYRYRDQLYRVLVHGQTGKLVGDAPISWWKVAAAIAAVALFVAALFGCLGLAGALGVVADAAHEGARSAPRARN